METIHVKEVLSFLERVHLSLSKKKEMEALQHAIEDIINMFEGITIRSKKQTILFFIFFHR